MQDTFLAPPQTPDFTSRVTWRIIHGNAGILKIFHWASKYFFMFDNHLRVVFSSWATFWNVFVCSSSLRSFFSFFLNRINPFISPLFCFFLLPSGFHQCHYWPYSKCQCYLLSVNPAVHSPIFWTVGLYLKIHSPIPTINTENKRIVLINLGNDCFSFFVSDCTFSK